jgi:catechol 2,3-dioxygenase
LSERVANNALSRDIAHIHHAELLTPYPEESERFFVELFGMQAVARAGQSVFLCGWGETQVYGLKLTEARLPGLGHLALRAWDPDGLERPWRRSRRPGSGRPGARATSPTGRPTGSATPPGTPWRSCSRPSATCRPRSCAPG